MRVISKIKGAGLILSGAAAGAAVALLFAPKAGIQTRKDIRRFSRKTAHQLDDFKCNLQDQINEGYSQVKKLLKTA
jgi:gas vesicle protein